VASCNGHRIRRPTAIAQSDAFRPAFPVQIGHRFQSISATCSAQVAPGGCPHASTQQRYAGRGQTVGLHNKADLIRNLAPRPGPDPSRTLAFAESGRAPTLQTHYLPRPLPSMWLITWSRPGSGMPLYSQAVSSFSDTIGNPFTEHQQFPG